MADSDALMVHGGRVGVGFLINFSRWGMGMSIMFCHQIIEILCDCQVNQ